MNAVITKKEKNRIRILGATAGVFGLVSGSIGLYMREQLVLSKTNWKIEGIPEFTEGYFGVMSGFPLFLLGTVGYALVYSRLSWMVFVYGLLSLSCDVLCVVDALMVIPYTKENGKFAWDKQGCNSTSNNTTVVVTTNTNLNDINASSCEEFEIIAILLICITTAVLVEFLLSTIRTLATGVALCRAKDISAPEQPSVPLALFSTPKHFQPTSYNNTVYQTDGFRP